MLTTDKRVACNRTVQRFTKKKRQQINDGFAVFFALLLLG